MLSMCIYCIWLVNTFNSEFMIQTHHLKKSPEKEALSYSWGTGEVQLIAQRWGENEIKHIYREGEMEDSET